MLKGFEEYTGPLNEYEYKVVLPQLVRLLRGCVGDARAQTNAQLRAQLEYGGFKVTDPRIRAIINEIRTSDAVPYLVASSKGYYIATSVEEVEDYARTLDSRIREMVRVRDALLSQVEGKLFLNQN